MHPTLARLMDYRCISGEVTQAPLYVYRALRPREEKAPEVRSKTTHFRWRVCAQCGVNHGGGDMEVSPPTPAHVLMDGMHGTGARWVVVHCTGPYSPTTMALDP